jgi:hypothetical protein
VLCSCYVFYNYDLLVFTLHVLSMFRNLCFVRGHCVLTTCLQDICTKRDPCYFIRNCVLTVLFVCISGELAMLFAIAMYVLTMYVLGMFFLSIHHATNYVSMCSFVLGSHDVLNMSVLCSGNARVMVVLLCLFDVCSYAVLSNKYYYGILLLSYILSPTFFLFADYALPRSLLCFCLVLARF